MIPVLRRLVTVLPRWCSVRGVLDDAASTCELKTGRIDPALCVLHLPTWRYLLSDGRPVVSSQFDGCTSKRSNDGATPLHSDL